MSRLITKLLLSMAALPLASLVFVIAGLISINHFLNFFGKTNIIDEFLFIFIPYAATSLTLVACWTVIWRKTVRWTAPRVWMTLAVAFGCLAAPAVLLGVTTMLWSSGDWLLRLLLSSVLLTIPLQLTLIWRQSRSEQAMVIEQWRLAPTPHCPHCMGRLGGCVGGQCPHCAGDLEGKPDVEVER